MASTGGVPPAAARPGAPAPAGATPRGRTPLGRVMIKRVLVVVAIALLVNEIVVFRAAQAFESRLSRHGRSDLAIVWANFVSLRDRSVLHIATLPLGFRLERWLVGAADDLTADYLSDTPTIREGGWRQAAALLRRAQELSPGNGGIRARVRYCEGQLARIDAEALRERRSPDARARFNEARRAFADAAELRRGWPDPYLALARVESAGFADVDRTREALDRARHAGYRLGDRETAVEADAHLLRAERTWRAVPGLPDEERYLERIREDCDRALELYDGVPAYGNVSQSIRRVHALRARVEQREAELRAASFAPTPGDETQGPADTTSEPQSQ